MMLPTTDVWLGDVLRACAALRDSGVAERDIIEALGFERREATPLVDDDDGDADDPEPVVAPDPTTAGTSGADEGPPTTADAPRSEPELDVLAPIGRVEPQPVTGGAPSAVAEETEAHYDRPDRLEPLLHPRWTFGIVYAVASTPSPRGAVEVDRLVDRVARLEPIERVPRRPRDSLHRGVQLLVDIGVGMLPFLRDQFELAATIVEIIGDEHVERLRFRGCPTTSEGAGPGAFDTWAPYRPPDPGAPVIALTDFGIAGPVDVPRADVVGSWIALAEQLERSGSHITAFVPYAADRFPAGIRSAISLVPWDRTTDVSAVRQAMRSAGR